MKVNVLRKKDKKNLFTSPIFREQITKKFVEILIVIPVLILLLLWVIEIVLAPWRVQKQCKMMQSVIKDLKEKTLLDAFETFWNGLGNGIK